MSGFCFRKRNVPLRRAAASSWLRSSKILAFSGRPDSLTKQLRDKLHTSGRHRLGAVHHELLPSRHYRLNERGEHEAVLDAVALKINQRPAAVGYVYKREDVEPDAVPAVQLK